MQMGKLLRAMAAISFASVSGLTLGRQLPPTAVRLRPVPRSSDRFSVSVGAKMQRHSGAGGRGAHRRRKALRAAGRAY